MAREKFERTKPHPASGKSQLWQQWYGSGLTLIAFIIRKNFKTDHLWRLYDATPYTITHPA